MGLSARTLVLITLYQYGKIPEEVLGRFLDEVFFPTALKRLVEYGVRNNYVKTLLNFDGIPELHNYIKKYSSFISPELSEEDEELYHLITDTMRAMESENISEKVFAADRLIHYQHHTANYLDEDLETEYTIAERVIEKVL